MVPAGTRDKYKTKGWTDEVFKGGVFGEDGISINGIGDAFDDLKFNQVFTWDSKMRCKMGLFIIGMFAGAVIGVTVMCILNMSK